MAFARCAGEDLIDAPDRHSELRHLWRPKCPASMSALARSRRSATSDEAGCRGSLSNCVLTNIDARCGHRVSQITASARRVAARVCAIRTPRNRGRACSHLCTTSTTAPSTTSQKEHGDECETLDPATVRARGVRHERHHANDPDRLKQIAGRYVRGYPSQSARLR